MRIQWEMGGDPEESQAKGTGGAAPLPPPTGLAALIWNRTKKALLSLGSPLMSGLATGDTVIPHCR